MSIQELRESKNTYPEDESKNLEHAKYTKETIEENLLYINRVLRRSLYASLAIVGVLVGCVVFLAYKNPMIPVLVRSDATGNIETVGLIKEIKAEPNEAEIRHFIEKFIEKARKLPLDPVVVKDNRVEVAAFTDTATRAKLVEDLRKERMNERIGTETSQLQMVSNVKQSPNTYRVSWREEVFNRDGTVKDRYNMTGTFTIKIVKGGKNENWRINPLNMVIVHYDWQRELR